MYYITTEASFDAAHFLSGYPGKCKNIHGHRWRVLLKIKSKELSAATEHHGMICDFSDLKTDLKALADTFDHTLIYEKNTLSNDLLTLLKQEQFALQEVSFRPTAENFAYFIYQEMAQKGYSIAETTVFETPTNSASYSEEV